MKLNIGCGEFYVEGWTNVDITREEGGPQPDVIAYAHDLPFEDGSASHVYAGHLLEHVELSDVKSILREFRRVLSDTGELMLTGPDLDRAVVGWPELLDELRYGAQRWHGDTHYWESTEAKVLELLEEDGWKAAPVPITQVPSIWPLASQIGWQYAIKAQIV